MIREVFFNRWSIGAIGILVLVVVACILWYNYTTMPLSKEAAKATEKLRQWEATKTVEQPSVTSMKDETQDTQKLTHESTDHEKISNKNEISIEEESVSPHGFGTYPDLPLGFSPNIWSNATFEDELMLRVRIKLLKQGVDVTNTVMIDGLVYPIIKGIRYVTWEVTPYGRQYISGSLGHLHDEVVLTEISKKMKKQRKSLSQEDVPNIKLVPVEEGGIDPYTFLDLIK